MSTDKAKGFPYLCGARTPACSVPLLGTLLVDRRASTRVSMRHAGVRAPRRLVAQSDSLAVPEYRLTSGGLSQVCLVSARQTSVSAPRRFPHAAQGFKS